MTAAKEPGVPCTEECWTPVPCRECETPLPPRGRSVPLEMYVCECDREQSNPRHLWDRHDGAREYNDPQGWAGHVASCKRCRDDYE